MSSQAGTQFQGVAKALSENPIISALVSQLPLGIVVASRDGQLEYVNAIASTLFAEQRRPCEKPACDEPDALEPVRWIIGRALLTNEVIRDEEIQYIAKNDEWRTLSVSATPVEQTYVGAAHVVVTLHDVTERNRSREWEPLVRSLSRL